MLDNKTLLDNINARLNKVINGERLNVELIEVGDLVKTATMVLVSLGDKVNVNEDLNSWRVAVKNIDLRAENDNLFIFEALFYIYMLSKEILISEYDGNKTKKALSLINNAKNLLQVHGSDLYNDLESNIFIYEDVIKFRLFNERVKKDSENNVNDHIEEMLSVKKEEVDKISKDILENKKVLESIESNTAFTSIFAGFEQYSDSVRKNLQRVSREVNVLKLLMVLMPLVGVFYSVINGTDFKIYLGIFSLLIVFGLLLRFSARKEDQLQQLLSNINTRTSLAVFHKYQLIGMDEGEKLIAHEKFQSFIYTDIKTNEWHAPDIAESVAQIIKSVRK